MREGEIRHWVERGRQAAGNPSAGRPPAGFEGVVLVANLPLYIYVYTCIYKGRFEGRRQQGAP